MCIQVRLGTHEARPRASGPHCPSRETGPCWRATEIPQGAQWEGVAVSFAGQRAEGVGGLVPGVQVKRVDSDRRDAREGPWVSWRPAYLLGGARRQQFSQTAWFLLRMAGLGEGYRGSPHV